MRGKVLWNDDRETVRTACLSRDSLLSSQWSNMPRGTAGAGPARAWVCSSCRATLLLAAWNTRLAGAA